MYDYGALTPTRRDLGNKGISNSPYLFFYAKVSYVVLSSDDTYYEDEQSIGSILFTTIYNTEGVIQNSSRAYPYNTSLKDIPLVNEIVRIDIAPSVNIDSNFQSSTYYYTRCVDLYNIANSNIQKTRNKNYVDSEYYIDISEVTKPLLPSTGDLIVQGRLGQSIRLGGYYSPGISTLTGIENNSKPFIIVRTPDTTAISNGSHSVEDINVDNTSVYLTSDHKVNLELANTGRKAYKVSPVEVDSYKGRQFVVSSGRVVLNAKDDDVLISSKNSIGVNSKSVSIEADSYVGVESPEIFLGQEAINLPQQKKEPAVLGLQNKKTLELILSQFEEISETFINVTPNVTNIAGSLVSLGLVIQAQNLLIRELLEKVNSKKVYIDSGRSQNAIS